MSAPLPPRTRFEVHAKWALEASKGDHTTVTYSERDGGTCRFANNQITQHVATNRRLLTVTVAFGRQHGSSATSDLTRAGIRAAVKRAGMIARVSPPDPEFLPPLPKQTYGGRKTWSERTRRPNPQRLIADAVVAVKLCQEARLDAAGIVSAEHGHHGVAASSGLFAFEERTTAEFSLTATGKDATGWARSRHRSIDALDVEARTKTAIEKAHASGGPREIPPGRYTVVLEPAAVVGLVSPLRWQLDAKGYHRGTSAFSGMLGQQVIDPRLTLRNAPGDARLLGNGFNDYGLPSEDATWIEDGVLKRLAYDRFTAKEHGARPTYPLDAPHLSGAPARSMDALVAGTERGILVTNFWYIRFVNPTDLTLTGMTRDGTFLIENGKITTGLVNFRWHDSPLRAFNAVEAFSEPREAVTTSGPKMLLPAMKIRDFNFSSVTRF